MEPESASPRPPSLSRRIAIAVLIFLGYYLLAKTGLLLATINKSASPIWPASGFAIAAFSRWGRKYWFAVTLAALFANFQTGMRQPVALVLISLGNTLEGIIGSRIIDRITRKNRELFGAETLLGVLSTVVLATPVSAALGTFALYAVAIIGRDQMIQNATTWWTGDSLGVLLFAPFFIRIFAGEFGGLRARARALAVTLFSAGVAWFIFRPHAPMVLLFLTYPTLYLAVRALRPGESGFVTLIFTGAAIWSTVSGFGPFNVGSTNDNLICVALFLASLAFTEQGLQFIRATGTGRISLAVVFTGWIAGAVVLNGFNKNEDDVDRSHYQTLVQNTLTRFRQRALLYESGLRAGVALFQASSRVTPREWQVFVDTLDTPSNFPGSLGFGYVAVVKTDGLAAFSRRIRAESNAEFTPHTVDDRPIRIGPDANREHFVIVSVEPGPRNSRAIGLDLSSEPKRREAALRAASTGLPEVTEPIRLVQTGQRLGFLLFLSIAKERKDLGWIYTPLVIDEFVGNTGDANAGEIAFEMDFVGADANGTETIFVSDREAIANSRKAPIESVLELWGHTIRFRWYQTAKFETRHDTTSAWVIFTAALLSILLTAFIAILASLNRKANELAERQAGEIRTQRAKLEHSARLATLGEMAGGIAHEINNPLVILSGRALLLAKLAESETPKPEIIRQNTAKILETVDRMAKIISGLRSLSRDGERDPFRPVTIAKIFSATMDLCTERFRSQQIDFRIATPSRIEVVCREVQVVQVLLNLLNNAFDAVLVGEPRWISLEARILPGAVEFIVADSGPGIPGPVAENMMAPFFTTKPVGQGTGLGLSISSGIAADHLGSLKYVPENGRTRFVFSISRALRPA